ncbi:rho GTPase-activating protein 5-like [Haemaphysalis longicornis]
MVFAGQGDLLRDEPINRAKSLQCPFVVVGGGLDPVRLEQALCALVESIERRAGRLHIYQALSAAAGPRPDLRLMLCMLCGDPYAPEQVLAPLLAQPGCLVCLVHPGLPATWSLLPVRRPCSSACRTGPRGTGMLTM